MIKDHSTTSATILYYVVSPVHVRNAGLLLAQLESCAFHLLYERGNDWLREDDLNRLPGGNTIVSPRDIPESIWSPNVRAIIFSTAQPRALPVALLEEAMKRNIPTIAIEESNQIALNQGRVNNYILPVDHLFVASDCERRGMGKTGRDENSIIVTGWPFYSGRSEKLSAIERDELKKELELDISNPVALLTLTGLNTAGENPETRRELISLAAHGLPGDYQLLIKPHPIEPLETLVPFVEECAPQARVIDGRIDVNRLLDATDVLLNRGVSQVCIEALFHGVPVVVLDTGIQTPFHGAASEVIASKQEDIVQIIHSLEKREKWEEAYKSFFAEHVPYSALESRALVCERIKRVVSNGECYADRGGQWFFLALVQAWIGDRTSAIRSIKKASEIAPEYPYRELESLIVHGASRGDIGKLREYLSSDLGSHLLRSLWIDQLAVTKAEVADDDLSWISDFPPVMMAEWYLYFVKKWSFYLVRAGHAQRSMRYVGEVSKKYPAMPGIQKLERDISSYCNSLVGRLRVGAELRLRELYRFFKCRVGL